MGVWTVRQSLKVNDGLILTIKALYDGFRSSVLVNNKVWVVVPHDRGRSLGLHLFPVLFNINLKKVMRNTLDDDKFSFSIGGRPISNLRFADDIDMIAGSNSELQSDGQVELMRTAVWDGDQRGEEQGHDERHQSSRGLYQAERRTTGTGPGLQIPRIDPN